MNNYKNNQIQFLDEIVIKKCINMANGSIQVFNNDSQILFRDSQNTKSIKDLITDIVNDTMNNKILGSENLIFSSSNINVDLSNLEDDSNTVNITIDNNQCLRIIFNNSYLFEKNQYYPVQINIDYNGNFINDYDDHLASIIASPTSDNFLIQANIFKVSETNKYIISFLNLNNSNYVFSEYNNFIDLKVIFSSITYS